MRLASVRSVLGAPAARSRRAAALGAVAATALLLAACGSSGGGASGSASGSASSSSSGSASGSGGGGSSTKDLKIGLVDFDPTSLGAEVQVQAMHTAFQSEGWQVLEQSSNGDVSSANTICDQFVTQNVSAVVTEVWTVSQMAQCLATAGAKNIPVFFAASNLDKGAAGAISTTGAAPINQLFIKNLKTLKNPIVFAINYTPGLPCLDRKLDFEKKMKAEAPSIQIVNHEGVIPGAVQDATAATQAFLNGHPASGKNQVAIWTCDADQATGALSALRQVNRSGIPIYTWDLGQESVKPIESGDFTATLIVPPDSMGSTAVKMVKNYLSNHKPVQYNAATTIVTKSNVKQICSSSPALCK